jgi:hypothetical protein
MLRLFALRAMAGEVERRGTGPFHIRFKVQPGEFRPYLAEASRKTGGGCQAPVLMAWSGQYILNTR